MVMCISKMMSLATMASLATAHSIPYSEESQQIYFMETTMEVGKNFKYVESRILNARFFCMCGAPVKTNQVWGGVVLDGCCVLVVSDCLKCMR